MSEVCTVAFQSEASDTAADQYRRLTGMVVTVVPAQGVVFDAELLELLVSVDGQYKGRFAP
jgi:hypothetical protein